MCSMRISGRVGYGKTPLTPALSTVQTVDNGNSGEEGTIANLLLHYEMFAEPSNPPITMSDEETNR